MGVVLSPASTWGRALGSALGLLVVVLVVLIVVVFLVAMAVVLLYHCVRIYAGINLLILAT